MLSLTLSGDKQISDPATPQAQPGDSMAASSTTGTFYLPLLLFALLSNPNLDWQSQKLAASAGRPLH